MDNVTVTDVVNILTKLPSEQIATVYEFALSLHASSSEHIGISEGWSDHDLEYTSTDSLRYTDSVEEELSPYVVVKPTTPVKLSELAGVGEKLWKAIDVDQYIDQERDSWDR